MLIKSFTLVGNGRRYSGRSAMLALELRSSVGLLTFQTSEGRRQLDFYPSLFFPHIFFSLLSIKFARDLSADHGTQTYGKLTSEVRGPASPLALQTCGSHTDLDHSNPPFFFGFS